MILVGGLLMNQILVIRDTFTEHSTIGKLYINGKYICNTLEDSVKPKGIKIKAKTAVEQGGYTVVLTHSNRFKRVMPLLLSVSNFKGIRIHKGNTADNTEGCILVGTHRCKDKIWGCQKPFNQIMRLLKDGSSFISIHNKS